MTKKIVSIFLLTCILMITACSGAPELLSFIDENAGSETLGGMTLYFKAALGPEDPLDKEDNTGYLGYARNTTFADMAKARIEEVEKTLDVNIELSQECPNGFFEDIIYLLASGGGKLDANIGMGYEEIEMRSLSQALLPMSYVSEYIDIYDSAKWGSPERLEMFAWDGEIYGVIPNYWPELQFASSDFVLVPNIDYIKSIGQDDPRDYFENGVWTLEKLEELIPIYAKPSSNAEEVVYGYTANDRHLYELLVQYYGADWAQKGEDGTWELGQLTEQGRQAAQKLRDYWVGDLSDMIYFGSVGDQAPLWAKNQAAISTMHTVTLTEPTSEIAQAGYEYGVLPFPSQDGKTIFGQYERNVEAIMIPTFTENYMEAAKVLSALYEPFEGYEDDETLKEMYNSSIFFDERDTEIIFKLKDSLRVMPKSQTLSDVNYAISEGLKNTEVSAILEKHAVKLQTVLEEELVPIKETMEELFPGYND